ncbi:MAG: hypothetical protein CMM49_05125 [Rhodospirillaceae bacterium]|nr:hypothetical protein [Rhodospirillaceae bacterium]|tara:strand:+ start:83088 stop:84503 length:1416 start_codon:yes stop_codon:yes gene_type:complete
MQEEWDVIVVGAGTAGIPAAIFSGQRGAKVLLIDADERIGGTLHWSTGQMTAAGTKLQKKLGIEDHPDWHFEDCMRISGGDLHPSLAKIAIDNAAVSFDWLMDNGFEVSPETPVAGHGHEPQRVRRYAWGPNGGLSVLEVMEPILNTEIGKGTVTLSLETKLSSLIYDSEEVIGVRIKARDGTEAEIYGKNIVLTTGGYAANEDLWKQMTPNYPLRSWCNPYSKGEGIIAAKKIGAKVDGGNEFLCSFAGIMQDPNDPLSVRSGLILNPHMRQPWEIFVNNNGERFVREDHPSVDHREHALLNQSNMEMYIVFDEGIRQNSPNINHEIQREHTIHLYESHPSYFKADTIEELARKCGMDEIKLKQSIDGYNLSVEKVHADPFKRESLPRPINKPPYLAIRAVGFTVLSPGGLDVDDDLRVLDQKNRPIANLYAAGEIYGKSRLSGKTYLSGMSLLPALTFGRLLGQKILNW